LIHEKAISLSFDLFKWIKASVGLACIALSLMVVGTWILQKPGVVWQPYSVELIEKAREEGKPVIIDFYAAWCAPCREMDEITFHHPDVVNKSKEFVMVKLDLTTGGGPLYQQLIKDFDVKGVPTIVFLGPDGQERRDLRVVEYMGSAQFLENMNK